MKKILFSLLAVALLLTGCTSNETNNNSEEPLVLEELAEDFPEELIPVSDLNGGVVTSALSFTVGDGMRDTITIGINKEGIEVINYIRNNLESLGVYEETSDSTNSYYEAIGSCYFSGTYNEREYYISVEDTEDYQTTIFISLKQ
jgi:hypothetical protein